MLFYWRRTLRIWPALAAFLAVYVAAIGIGSAHQTEHLQAAMWTALSLRNWSMIWDAPLGLVGHTWTLSVEEQFYLAWPLLLVLILRKFGRTAVAPTIVALLLCSLVWRWHIAQGDIIASRLYFGTDTHADPILMGCLLASIPRTIRERSPGWLGLALLGPILFARSSSISYFLWVFTASGVAAALMIGSLKGGPFALPPMVWLGRRSYGLYLWHGPVLKLMMIAAWDAPWKLILIGVPISLALAMASYRFIEQPVRAWRSAARTPSLDIIVPQRTN